MKTAQRRLVLGPKLAGARLSPEEFDAVEECDELFVYELLNGILIVSPPPSEAERGPNELLGYLLLSYKERHPQGKALDDTLPEHLVRVKSNRRRADRVIWAGLGRAPNVNRDLPPIVVEFVSPGRRNRKRDYEAKRKEYREVSIAEYWVIDRFRREMTVYRGPANRLKEIVVREGEVYRTPLLPGFELPLALLFRRVDALREAQEGKDAG